MALDKTAFLAKIAASRESEEVEIKNIGPCRLRKATSLELADYFDLARAAGESQALLFKANYFLVGKCLIDDSGARLFTDDQVESALSDSTLETINSLMEKTMTISRSKVEEAAKNLSDPIPDSSPSN